jgi:large subunit ribosomal protein L9
VICRFLEGYKRMKVILLSDVYKHGVAGEVVEVTDGFARNWLMPKKLAAKATATALKQAESLRAQAETRRAALDERLNDLGRQINGVELVFGRRASPTGKLFGSVTTTEIADLLNQQTGIDINRRRISQQSLREIGTHDVPVRLGSDVSPSLRIIIVREEEYPAFMAARAAGQHPEVEEVPHAAEETAEAAEPTDAGAGDETAQSEPASAE